MLKLLQIYEEIFSSIKELELMKWMLLVALSLSAFTAQGQDLNPFHCGYYAQESQEEELATYLEKSIVQVAKFAAGDFMKELKNQGLNEFSALDMTLDHYHQVLTQTSEISFNAFYIQAKKEGTGIQFIKKICRNPETSLHDIVRPAFDATTIRVMEEINKNRKD